MNNETKGIIKEVMTIANNLSYSHSISLDDKHDLETIVFKLRDLIVSEDLFKFVEENSNSNDVVTESRIDLVNRINNIVDDLILDDDNYKQYLITNINDDKQIIKGINEFIGKFIEIERA